MDLNKKINNIFKKAQIVMLVLLIMLNTTATFFWAETIANNYEAVEAVLENKTPITIIMYHAIMKDKSRSGDFVISPDQVESDIKYLKDNGYNFITITDLISYVNDVFFMLPEKPVIITFDDGYYNNYLYVFPILKKYDAKIVLSIIGKQTDINKEGEKLSPAYSHVTWEQIEEMKKSGHVEIQNHSYNLHSLTGSRSAAMRKSGESIENYTEMLTGDLMKLQNLLKEKVNITPNAFAFPFGKISDESLEIIKGLGFDAALSCYEGINYIGKGDTELLFKLKRFNRPFGKSSESFFRGKLK